MKNRVLVVDDDEDQCALLLASLERLGYAVTIESSPQAAVELAAREAIDCVLTDLGMHEMSGTDLTERVLGARPDLPVIVVTGRGSLETAIAAMRVGAYDFLTKPVDPKLLALSVARAIEHGRLQRETKKLRELVADHPTVETLVGDSPTMRRVYDLVARVADSGASVLIHGETGTGKELVARAIHNMGTRKGGPFVAINCAAVPATLLESELFGHVRGAFTDAKAARPGLFVEASGGTIFLDEIGEMPLEMQPKLLRALQERTVRPVGSNVEVPFDARIVAATHRELETEVHARRFRQDLYYRINVVRIDIPTLRERGADVLALAAHFLDKFAARGSRHPLTLSAQVAERLLAYDWPGNVRELENCVERAVALACSDQLMVDDLPDRIRAYRPDVFSVSVDQTDEIISLEELQRRHILRVIGLVNHNKSRAAQLLGLDRRTLYRKLERSGTRAKNERCTEQVTEGSA